MLGGTMLNSLRCFEIYSETFVTQTLWSEEGNDRILASVTEGTEQTAWLHSPRTPECAQIEKHCLPFSACEV